LIFFLKNKSKKLFGCYHRICGEGGDLPRRQACMRINQRQDLRQAGQTSTAAKNTF